MGLDCTGRGGDLGLECDIDCGDNQLSLVASGDAPSRELATLLKRFNTAVADPERHTIGGFAETVMALHAELALLAEHFSTVAERAAADGLDGQAPDLGDLLVEFDAPTEMADRP